MQHLLATTLLFGILIASVAARLQSVATEGTLTCKGEPGRSLKIELWDQDSIDPDDFMGATVSTTEGRFSIEGKESEFTKIDPELRIYHKCGNPNAQCFKQTKIVIPDEYITYNAIKPEKMYKIGRIELSLEISTESSICSENKN